MLPPGGRVLGDEVFGQVEVERAGGEGGPVDGVLRRHDSARVSRKGAGSSTDGRGRFRFGRMRFAAGAGPCYDGVMKAREGALARAQYLVIRSIFAVIEVFPLSWNLRTARVLARVWRFLMPRHYERARDHLQAAYGGEWSQLEIERVAHEVLVDTTRFAIETISLPRLLSGRTIRRYVDLRGVSEVLQLLLAGRGVIFVTGHYGSFEVPGHVLASLGFPFNAVMRPLDNVYLNDFLVRTRRRHGMTLLNKKGAAEQAEALLGRGEPVAFIADQDAGRKGVFVDFFGRPASTYKSIGLLAMQTNSPIAVGYARRAGRGAKYEVGVNRVIHPEDWQGERDPLRWITQEYTSAIEAFVREAPEQYLWIHRRWKSKPGQKRARK